ncbi:MAG: T9SS C-terminal target domain-containing protein [Chitinophagia bacterium]|nr:T9SS C-terminal target domain-containing protein [Chitinophagia bacterium]
MKYALSLLLVLNMVVCCRGQLPHPTRLWANSYGGNATDYFSQVVTRCPDGGFIVGIGGNSNYGTGNIDSFCNYINRKSIFLKLNSDASSIEWSKCFPIDGDSTFSCVFPTPDGGIVLAGQFGTRVNWGFIITKQDSAGNTIWQHNYSKGRDILVRDVIQSDDRGYMMLAESIYTDSNASLHYGSFMYADLLLLKMDSNGTKIWSVVIGGTSQEYAAKIVDAPGHGCYVIGSTSSNDHDCTGNHGLYDVYLTRLDSNGNLLWHKVLGGSGNDLAHFAIPNGKGGLIIAAESDSHDGDIHHTTGLGDFWIAELDSNADIIWENSYGSHQYGSAKFICRSNDGTLWVGGQIGGKGADVDTFYDRINYDGWLLHIDSIGNRLGAVTIGSKWLDDISFVTPLAGNAVMVGGFYSTNDGYFNFPNFYGSSDAFLMTFAPWTTAVTGPESLPPIYVHPNPARDQLIFDGLESAEIYKVFINNTVGQKKITAIVTAGKNKTDISFLADGQYFVIIQDEKGNQFTQQINVIK